MSFHKDSQVTRHEGGYRVEYADGWRQGKGAFGGLVGAHFVRAIEDVVDDPDLHLRTLTCHFCTPALPGPADLLVEIARAGRSVTHASARILQGENVVALASATLARNRDLGPGIPVISAPAMPAVPPPDETVVILRPDRPGSPPFTRHLQYRFCAGQPPFSSGSEPVLGGWTRFHDSGPADAAMLTGLSDVWPPGVFAMLNTGRPAATMTMTCHFLARFPLSDASPDDYYMVINRCHAGDSGYSDQENLLWTASGQLVMRVFQMVTIIK